MGKHNEYCPTCGAPGDHKDRLEAATTACLGMAELVWEKTKIPVSVGKSVALSGKFPISEAEWKVLRESLASMKPGLVLPEDPQEAPDGN